LNRQFDLRWRLTLRDIEVIVVDDGSKDRTPDIVSNIGDRAWSSCDYVRAAARRDREMSESRVRRPLMLRSLDSDDLIKAWKLSAAVTTLDRHPEAGFAFARFRANRRRWKAYHGVCLGELSRVQRARQPSPSGTPRYLMPQAELARGLLYENFIGTSGVVLRKHLLTKIGPFDDSLTYSEDRDLCFDSAMTAARCIRTASVIRIE